MSHKSTIKMKINDKATLLRALDSMGIEYETASTENGLVTESRYDVKVNVDVRLKQDSHGKDLKAVGFKKNADNTYEASGDFYVISGARTKDGEQLSESKFKETISKRYTYTRAVTELQNAGYAMSSDIQDWTNDEDLSFTLMRQI